MPDNYMLYAGVIDSAVYDCIKCGLIKVSKKVSISVRSIEAFQELEPLYSYLNNFRQFLTSKLNGRQSTKQRSITSRISGRHTLTRSSIAEQEKLANMLICYECGLVAKNDSRWLEWSQSLAQHTS